MTDIEMLNSENARLTKLVIELRAEAVRLNAQADTAPAGSGGWEAHAKELERELAYWKQRAKTILEHQDDQCLHCRGDGMDPDCDYLLPRPDCGGPL